MSYDALSSWECSWIIMYQKFICQVLWQSRQTWSFHKHMYSFFKANDFLAKTDQFSLNVIAGDIRTLVKVLRIFFFIYILSNLKLILSVFCRQEDTLAFTPWCLISCLCVSGWKGQDNLNSVPSFVILWELTCIHTKGTPLS